jgi:hypothetical protein
MLAAPTPPSPTDVWDELKEKLGLNEFTAKRADSSGVGFQGWTSESLLKPCADGERTAHLVGLAGTYFSLGFNLNQVTEHCLMWNRQNIEPLEDDKVISTCRSIAATDARNHPNRTQGVALNQLPPSAPIVPLFNIADARIDAFLFNLPPPQRWVLAGLLPLGIVAAYVAQGGVGKSQLLMQLCYSVATGVPLAGFWPVGEQGTVLMLCAEDSRAEIHRRVHRIHAQIGASMPNNARKQLEDRFLVRSMVGQDVLLTTATRNSEVVRTPLLEQLLLTAKQATNLKLIIIDPAARFRGGDENSNADATRFVQALEYLAQSTGATVLIAHHSGKGASSAKEADQNASRGASALTDGIRWQMALTPLTGGITGYASIPQDQRHLYLEARLVKTNYTAPQPPVLLRRCPDGYLEAISVPQSVQTDATLVEVLHTLHSSAKGLTARQFESLHGGLKKSLKLSERAVRAVLDEACARGFLIKVNGKPLQLTPDGVAWVHSKTSTNSSAARQAPHGSAARRKKAQ